MAIWDRFSKRAVRARKQDQEDVYPNENYPKNSVLWPFTSIVTVAITVWLLQTPCIVGEWKPTYSKTIEACHTVSTLVFSPDGNFLASGSKEGTINIWDVTTGKNIAKWIDHDGCFVLSVVYSPDGKFIASGSEDMTIKLWEAASGKRIATLTGHNSWVTCLAFGPDGRTLASGSGDKSIKLWDVATGKNIATLEKHVAEIQAIAFSHNGKILASGSSLDHVLAEDGKPTIKLWDVKTTKVIVTLTDDLCSVTSLAFSPDDTILASGSSEKKVRGEKGVPAIKLWDLKTYKNITTLTGPRKAILSVAFSLDGKTIFSGSADNSVMFWNIASGKCIALPQRHTNKVAEVVVSPNGKILASGSADKEIILWEIPVRESRDN